MNYKDLILNKLEENKQKNIELYKESGYTISALEKAYELTEKIMVNRFKNELKKQNFNEEKAYDKYTARLNLDYLNVYIEEMLLLDKPETQIEFYKAVRKEMRRILHTLYNLLKD